MKVRNIPSHGYSRYLFGVQYVGKYFCGWQSNVDAPSPTVQDTLKEAFRQFLRGKERHLNHLSALNFEKFRGSSRTDAKVNAIRNTFQIDLPMRQLTGSQRESNYTSPELCQAINFYLSSRHVAITDARVVSPSFDVRRDVESRTYFYRIFYRPAHIQPHYGYSNLFQKDFAWTIDEPLDVDAMIRASRCLLGWHDFSSFRNAGCDSPTPIRNIMRLEIREHEGGPSSDFLMDDYRLIVITIVANAFLLRMVRNIVAVLVEVGRGRKEVMEMELILRAKSRTVINKVSPAPPEGLYLQHVTHSFNPPVDFF